MNEHTADLQWAVQSIKYLVMSLHQHLNIQTQSFIMLYALRSAKPVKSFAFSLLLLKIKFKN